MPRYDDDITLTVGMDAEDVIDTSDRLTEKIRSIFEKSSGKIKSAAFVSLLTQMDQAVLKADQIQAKMQELASQTIVTPEYKEMEDSLARIDAQFTKLETKRRQLEKAGKMKSGEYTALESELERLHNEAERLRDSMQALQDAGAYVMSGVETEEYQRLADQLNQVNNRMVILQQRAYALGSSTSTAARSTNSLSISFSKLASTIQKAVSALIKFTSTMMRTVGSGIINGIKRLKSSMDGLGKSANQGNMNFKKLFRTILRYGIGVRSFYFLFRRLRKALVEGFENLAQAHEPFNQAVSSLMTAMAGLKNSFAAAFAPLIEFVAPALTNFINLVSEAVSKVGMLIAALTGKEFVKATPVQQNYAQSVDKTAKNSNAASKAMKKQNKQAKELKRTLASFDDVNILHEDKDTDNGSTTTPTGGASEVTFATAPIEGTFKAFADKLKEMWRGADFTDLGRIVGEKLLAALKKIPWDKIKTTLRNVAKSIVTFLNGFLEVPDLFTTIGKTIAEGINSSFEFLNSAVKNFHWDSLGKAIKDAILGALENLDWKLIYDTLSSAGAGVGTTLQTAFNNPRIWTDIFDTVAKGLNSLVYALDGFIKSINWADLAINIATGLNNGIKTIDWDAWAQTLIDLVNGAFDALYNFVVTFDFKDLGNKVGTAIATAIKGINWKEGAMSVAETINGLWEALLGFIEGVNGGTDGSGWKELGATIITAIGAFFSTIRWETIGSALNSATLALLDTFRGAFEEINWDELPQQIVDAISDFFSKFEWDKIADSASELLGDALGAAFTTIVAVGGWLYEKISSAFKSLIDGGLSGIVLKLQNIGDWLKTHVWEPLVKGFVNTFNIKKFIEIGMEIFNGVKQGITDAIMGIGSWIYFNIFKPLVDGIKSIFGISSPATSMMTFGSYIIQGLLAGIIGFLGDAVTWVTDHIFTPIVTAITSVFGIVGDTASALFEFGSAIISGLISGMQAIADTIGEWIDVHIVQPITDAIDTVTQIWDDFWGNSEDTTSVQYMEGMTAATDAYTDSLNRLATQMDDTSAWDALTTAMWTMYENGDLSKEAVARLQNVLQDAASSGQSFATYAGQIGWILEQDGISTNTFNSALGNTPSAVKNATDSIQEMGEKAEGASSTTADASTALNALADLKLSAPIKMAIISAAIDAIQKSSGLADEDAQHLKDTLNDYNTNPTEKGMQAISDAFDDAGISAQEFDKAFADALANSEDISMKEMTEILKVIQNAKDKLKKAGKEDGENITKGLQSGINSGKTDVNKESTKLIKDDVLGAIDTAADSHSPSKETTTRGVNLVQGLLDGIISLENNVVQEVSTLIQNMLQEMDMYQSSFVTTGNTMMQMLNEGINGWGYAPVNSLQTIANNMASTFNWIDWHGIGRNICNGINNGLLWGWNWLTNTARNLANNIANAARRALDIHSPSGVFENEIGAMIPKGLALGIMKTGQEPIDATADVVNGIMQEAEDADPTITLDSQLNATTDTLATILNNYSTIIVDNFTTLISSLENVGNLSAIAQGKIVPYSNAFVNHEEQNSNLTDIHDRLEALYDNRITREDIIDIVQRYINFSFSIGDEQIARHSAAGSLKLNRRYNPVRGTT